MKVQPYSQRQWCIAGTETPCADDYPEAKEVKVIESYGYLFFCPGCQEPHSVSVKGVNSIGKGPWTFNGNLDAPTFAPSVLLRADDESAICHSFVENGNIRFLSDCIHALAGQTVAIPEWDNW